MRSVNPKDFFFAILFLKVSYLPFPIFKEVFLRASALWQRIQL